MAEISDRGLEKECTFTAMRSSGPGGQNVNKVSTKIELAFHIMDSALLSDEEKEILTAKLATKINDEGYLKITSSESRSQSANKETAIEKLKETIEKALIKPKKRKPTKVPHAVKAKIRQTKILVSKKKATRQIKRRDWE